jgi:small subunit ribosomal protein S16
MGLLFGRSLGYDSAPISQGVSEYMLKIRLRRGGATHAPFYRIVVSDSLKTPAAATVEQVGHYDPKKNPADVKIDRARVDYWVSKGAQLSPTVKSLLKKYKA